MTKNAPKSPIISFIYTFTLQYKTHFHKNDKITKKKSINHWTSCIISTTTIGKKRTEKNFIQILDNHFQEMNFLLFCQSNFFSPFLFACAWMKNAWAFVLLSIFTSTEIVCASKYSWNFVFVRKSRVIHNVMYVHEYCGPIASLWIS